MFCQLFYIIHEYSGTLLGRTFNICLKKFHYIPVFNILKFTFNQTSNFISIICLMVQQNNNR